MNVNGTINFVPSWASVRIRIGTATSPVITLRGDINRNGNSASAGFALPLPSNSNVVVLEKNPLQTDTRLDSGQANLEVFTDAFRVTVS